MALSRILCLLSINTNFFLINRCYMYAWCLMLARDLDVPASTSPQTPETMQGNQHAMPSFCRVAGVCSGASTVLKSWLGYRFPCAGRGLISGLAISIPSALARHFTLPTRKSAHHRCRSPADETWRNPVFLKAHSLMSRCCDSWPSSHQQRSRRCRCMRHSTHLRPSHREICSRG